LKTIYKYPLVLTDLQEVTMHKGAFVLDAQLQNGKITLWVELDPAKPKETRKFRIIGTGHGFPPHEAVAYIATVQMPPLVWHVYEEV